LVSCQLPVEINDVTEKNAVLVILHLEASHSGSLYVDFFSRVYVAVFLPSFQGGTPEKRGSMADQFLCPVHLDLLLPGVHRQSGSYSRRMGAKGSPVVKCRSSRRAATVVSEMRGFQTAESTSLQDMSKVNLN
jgi:hypothetical protein